MVRWGLSRPAPPRSRAALGELGTGLIAQQFDELVVDETGLAKDLVEEPTFDIASGETALAPGGPLGGGRSSCEPVV